MVAPNQSAFIWGRSIHDNFVLVQHLAKYLHRRGDPRIMMKLDISKAFDSVSWSFLLEVLTRLGFGEKWRAVLCNLLASSSTRVLLNGEPGEEIIHRRGLRQGNPLSPMLFILVMEALTSLIQRADDLGLLTPLATRPVGHRLSIYADDVVLFASPTAAELEFIKALLRVFGEASGLRVNMSKSAVIPIRCVEEHVQQVSNSMECDVSSFPCRYLGLPLSTKRLTAAELQPIIDRIADLLPSWKAALLYKPGRLILAKAVLTLVPIHLLIALDVPRWLIKAIDKIRRGFLWCGRKDTQGGNCPVTWLRVTRPLNCGGLGVHDLERLSWALRMRWLWLRKTDPAKPWAFLDIQVPANVEAMFRISVVTMVGDGTSTLFWTDRWVDGKSIADPAPALLPFVRRRGWRKCMVAQALDNNAWMTDIVGGLPVLAAWQGFRLWEILSEVTLVLGTSDQHVWTLSATGQFTTKSAYERYFVGGVAFEPYKRLWKAWAPLKVKMLVWLALWKRCWTADRLARRGLAHPDRCPLCDQESEDIDHLLITCVTARETWFQVLQWCGLGALAPRQHERGLADWWQRASRRVASDKKKGLNSLVMLVVWNIWKHRNRCVFDNAQPGSQHILRAIREEASLWGLARAKSLREIM